MQRAATAAFLPNAMPQRLRRSCCRKPPPPTAAAAADGARNSCVPDEVARGQGAAAVPAVSLSRRTLLGAAAALAATAQAVQPPAAQAVQGLTAGRIPGVTGPDAEGWYTYQRPEGKSGGHGVGWSEIQRYKFKVPSDGWTEVPVSIADLGGTEIDLRYGSQDEGSLMVVVAPVLRFKDVGTNANIKITDLNSPENIIAGFAPELFGAPLQDGDLLDVQVVTKGGLPYYLYELSQHRLVSATATGNRVYMVSLRCNSRQWRKSGDKLLKMRDSFEVPPKVDV